MMQLRVDAEQMDAAIQALGMAQRVLRFGREPATQEATAAAVKWISEAVFILVQAEREVYDAA